MKDIISFILSHQAEIAAVLAAVVALLRAIPAPVYERFEAKYPRLALLARALRKISPDLLPAAKAVAAALRSMPAPAAPPPPVERPRTTTLPLPPSE